MLGCPRKEARASVQRHGAALIAADDPRLLGIVLGDGVAVVRQEHMFAVRPDEPGWS